MMNRILWLVAPTLLLSATGAIGQQQRANLGPAGCYALDLGEWKQGEPERSPPDTFRLLPDLDERPSPPGHAYRLVEPIWPNSLGATWERRGADSVWIGWSTGFVGLSLHMRVVADSLIGVARAWTDAIPLDREGRIVEPFAPAVARRIPCAAESASS